MALIAVVFLGSGDDSESKNRDDAATAVSLPSVEAAAPLKQETKLPKVRLLKTILGVKTRPSSETNITPLPIDSELLDALLPALMEKLK